MRTAFIAAVVTALVMTAIWGSTFAYGQWVKAYHAPQCQTK